VLPSLHLHTAPLPESIPALLLETILDFAALPSGHLLRLRGPELASAQPSSPSKQGIVLERWKVAFV
jgi:hypothetical protein